jgi:glucose-6-phosphate 1-dehydrogenase
LTSAKDLNEKIMEVFREEQIYRIDHYVGKEAIQNILAFRFANILFEPLWNNKYIDNIQITASENI